MTAAFTDFSVFDVPLLQLQVRMPSGAISKPERVAQVHRHVERAVTRARQQVEGLQAAVLEPRADRTLRKGLGRVEVHYDGVRVGDYPPERLEAVVRRYL